MNAPRIFACLIIFVALLTAEGAESQLEISKVSRETSLGAKLSPKEAGELELVLSKNPQDLSARTKLLGYYFLAQHLLPDGKMENRKHVLWVIKNRPEARIAGQPECHLYPVIDDEGYSAGKKLWMEQIQDNAKNPLILGNAAQYFLLTDIKLSEALLQKAIEVDPANPRWSRDLAGVYALQKGQQNPSKSLLENKRAAEKYLAILEKDFAANHMEFGLLGNLGEMAKTAFNAGETGKASDYAAQLLRQAEGHRKDWNYGNAIHDGNMVLGRIALARGDEKSAVKHLLQAGESTGSSPRPGFGPNMSLAKDLLEKGEKDAVLQYFESCRKYWTNGGNKLDKWVDDVNAGKLPDFGANLDY